MAINYTVYEHTVPTDPEGKKKAYAKAQIKERMDLQKLHKQMMVHGCPLKVGDLQIALSYLTDYMVEYLRDGNELIIEPLGTFRLQLKSEPAECADTFTKKNISGAVLQYVPSEKMLEATQELTFEQVPSRAVQKQMVRDSLNGKRRKAGRPRKSGN